MKKKMKRLLGILLSLALVLWLFPGMSLTALAEDEVSYLDASGAKQTCNSYTSVEGGVSAQWNAGWYVVKGAVNIEKWIVVAGAVNLILCDGASLTAGNNIELNPANASLTIYAGSTQEAIQGTGALTVNAGNAVNVYSGSATGDVLVINGGVVSLTSEYTVFNFENGSLTVNGGSLTAFATNNNQSAFKDSTNLIVKDGMVIKAGADAASADVVTGTDWKNKQYVSVTAPPHTHSFTDYTGSADTITAICTADKCPLPVVDDKPTATLTIAAPTAGGGAATLTGASDFGVSDADVEYSGDNGSTWSKTAPSGDGFYQARITVGGTYTATVSYGVNAISKDTAFNPTTAHGDFTVPAVAAVDAAVEIATTPDVGYVLDALTVTKTNGGTVTASVTGNTGTFTMPAENVTVSASFVARDVGVKLTVTGNTGTPCTAVLLNDDYTVTGDTFSKKMGERFILSVTTDEDYDYTVKINGNDAASNLTVFSDDDNKAYAEYLEHNKLTVPAQTELYWVTMPVVAEGDLDVAVTFGKVDSFTALYQPATAVDNGNTVWCKFTDSENRVYAAEMAKGLKVEDTTVWSVSLKSAFDPSKIAFVTVSKTAADSDLKAAIDGADLTVCSAQADTEWKTVSSDKYMVIGGNAKAVAAAFADGDNVTLGIGVCIIDEAGNVTTPGSVKAPAGPEKAGFTFGGWRGVQYDTGGKASEKIYAAGDSVPVRANTTLSAVWNPIVPKIDLDANGGEGGSNVTEVEYGEKLTIEENPTKKGFAFMDWLVDKSVTEDGTFFPRGVPFDFDTAITDDLDLTALWEHVHAFTCVPLDYSGFNGALSDYYDYLPYIHARFCGCADVKLEKHTFQNDVCTGCGYHQQPDATTEVKLEVSYWKQGETSAWMNELPRTVKKNEDVTVSTYYTIGDYQFSKWQYSTDSGETWKDLAATTLVGFIIPDDMMVRAIYVSTITQPQLELSASWYRDGGEMTINGQTVSLASVLFQMNYKLPDGYTFVDAGVRMGDNNGISYYEMKEYKQSTVEKAAEVGFSFGFNMIPFVGGGLEGFVGEQIDGVLLDDGPHYYYESRENNVLDEFTAATLSKYMIENKPVNVEQYPPIYWEAKAQTKGQTGSVNTLAPVNFIQKNDGNHYIYGMAWMTYKTPEGVTGTICTEAIPTTLNGLYEQKLITITKSDS